MIRLTLYSLLGWAASPCLALAWACGHLGLALPGSGLGLGLTGSFCIAVAMWQAVEDGTRSLALACSDLPGRWALAHLLESLAMGSNSAEPWVSPGHRHGGHRVISTFPADSFRLRIRQNLHLRSVLVAQRALAGWFFLFDRGRPELVDSAITASLKVQRKFKYSSLYFCTVRPLGSKSANGLSGPDSALRREPVQPQSSRFEPKFP